MRNLLPTKILPVLLFVLFSLTAEGALRLAMEIPGHPLKQVGESLVVNLKIQGRDTPADIYMAVKRTPNGNLVFISRTESGLMFTEAPIPYVAGWRPGNTEVEKFEIPALSRDIQTGEYTFYAVAVAAGVDVFSQSSWLSPLAIRKIFFVDNDNKLPIPDILRGSLNASGQKVFKLNLQKGSKSFLPGASTETFGINGNYLGPTIRISRGDEVAFEVTNRIGEYTTIHWHGAHVPAVMDGGPHQIINPGETWRPDFKIIQPAATLWYHPHPHGKTGKQVYKGLAGFIIVDDEISNSLPLPRRYGVDDIPIVVQDRNITPDGAMNYQIATRRDVMRGIRGTRILVNGEITPVLETRAQVIRLRLLNGSNARIYHFGFSDDRLFYQIATDGGLLESPVPLKRLTLSPGERAEILVDLRQDNDSYLTLKSYSSEITPSFTQGRGMLDVLDNQDFDILYLRIGGAGENQLAIPDRLTPMQRLSPASAKRTRTFVLRESMAGMMNSNGGRQTATPALTINDKTFDMERVDEAIRLGETEIWVIRSESRMAHPFHIHDVRFQILDRNGAPPPANERGWKDTVLVLPNETVRFIARFDDFADAEHPYMYHCHILEHEDAGMMGQFIVLP